MALDEHVFTVAGARATRAYPISLADAGLKERAHLQEWVIAHPQVLGEDVLIVASEFGRWSDSDGRRAWDRLDVLGLDSDGRLVVVELKRDAAPDTVDMQGLKYAALVSRMTADDLALLHAQYRSTRGSPTTPEKARELLEDHALLNAEVLVQPRLILMASAFPVPSPLPWSSCISSLASTCAW